MAPATVGAGAGPMAVETGKTSAGVVEPKVEETATMLAGAALRTVWGAVGPTSVGAERKAAEAVGEALRTSEEEEVAVGVALRVERGVDGGVRTPPR